MQPGREGRGQGVRRLRRGAAGLRPRASIDLRAADQGARRPTGSTARTETARDHASGGSSSTRRSTRACARPGASRCRSSNEHDGQGALKAIVSQPDPHLRQPGDRGSARRDQAARLPATPRARASRSRSATSRSAGGKTRHPRAGGGRGDAHRARVPPRPDHRRGALQRGRPGLDQGQGRDHDRGRGQGARPVRLGPHDGAVWGQG